jgi:hypothetical protein
MNFKLKLYTSLFAFANASSLWAAANDEQEGFTPEMICLIILILCSAFTIGLLLLGANSGKSGGRNKRDNDKIKNQLSTINNSLKAVLKKLKPEVAIQPRSIESVIDSSTASRDLYELKTDIINSRNSLNSELKELKTEVGNISLFLSKDNKNKLIDEIKNLQKINAEQERDINAAQMQIEQLSRQSNEIQNDFLQQIIPNEVTTLFNNITGFGGPECDPKLLDLYFAVISLHHKAEARDKDELRKGFIMFDGFLFDTFKDDVDSLTALREHFAELFNEDYLKGYFQIDWPAPGDIFDPSRQKSHMSSGNRIALAESAVICNSEGQVLVPARVETKR